MKLVGQGLGKKIKSYQKTFGKHGVGPRALQWVSGKAQKVRFRELLADIDLEGKSILDVGCGFGDILAFIEAKTGRFIYTGVDAVPEFIEVAREKHQGHEFIVGDYFGQPLRRKFDIIISSGALNSNIRNPLGYRKKAIKTMFDHAKEVVAFNMAGGHPQPRNKKGYKVWYAESLDVLRYCLGLTSRVILRHHYRRRDFTIVMFKDV